MTMIFCYFHYEPIQTLNYFEDAVRNRVSLQLGRDSEKLNLDANSKDFLHKFGLI